MYREAPWGSPLAQLRRLAKVTTQTAVGKGPDSNWHVRRDDFRQRPVGGGRSLWAQAGDWSDSGRPFDPEFVDFWSQTVKEKIQMWTNFDLHMAQQEDLSGQLARGVVTLMQNKGHKGRAEVYPLPSRILMLLRDGETVPAIAMVTGLLRSQVAEMLFLTPAVM